jgi:endonuclease/exonuclease/phosphatase family metal-dependent hydrolase
VVRRTGLGLVAALTVSCGAPDPATGGSTTASTSTGTDTMATAHPVEDGEPPTSPDLPPADTTRADETGSPPDAEIECHDGVDDDDDGALDCLDEDCWPVPACEERFLRVATFNVHEVGAPRSDEHEQLLAVLARIDADVVCLQEVGDDETEHLQALREAAGYAHFALAPPSGGMIRNACLSRHEIVQYAALGSADLSSDPQAAELTRAIVRARIHLPRLDRYVTVFTAHPKAGITDTDRFRRMVEAIRLGQAVAIEREQYRDNAIVVAGDLNEIPDYPGDLVFDTLPADLPPAYVLGSDIILPLAYAPFAPLEDEGLARVPAWVEDTRWEETYLPELLRLDYIYADAGELVVAEVYEACQDDGQDRPPHGGVLPKAGAPLRCGTNADASDHRPVVAVFYLPQ